MASDERMTSADESRRAAEASALVNNPLYREAFAVLEARLISELAKADIEPERGERIRLLFVALRKVHGYLDQLIQTGKMVEFADQHKRTIRDLMPWPR